MMAIIISSNNKSTEYFVSTHHSKAVPTSMTGRRLPILEVMRSLTIPIRGLTMNVTAEEKVQRIAGLTMNVIFEVKVQRFRGLTINVTSEEKVQRIRGLTLNVTSEEKV